MPAVSHRQPRPTGPMPSADPRPDAVLLSLFFTQSDEAAFAALVARHTPVVRAVCGGWLRCAADVDDAAQAAFLVLVRRADTVRDPNRLAGWLCGVAGNVARRLRKRLDRTGPLTADPPGRTPADADHRVEAVAAEVAVLPEKYRLPVQLHYTAGLSAAAIADRLGWPRGTVLTRLDRARELLKRRLAARGLSVAAGIGAVRPVSAAWVLATARAAAAWKGGLPAAASGVSERSVSLTEEVVRAMTWNKLRVALVAVVLVTAMGGFAFAQWMGSGPEKRKADAPQAAAPGAAEKPQPAKADDAKPPRADDPKPAAGRRREAVIRVPVGTFVKDVEAAPYGSGRMAWTFEDERILGKIEASLPMFGVDFEVQTEAEYSLSSNGTIYGVVTGVKVAHLKVNEALGKDAEQIKAMVGLLPLVEPLINETLTDLPFSYQFRLVGDRLTILNYRALLAGPNPLGKLGGLTGGTAELMPLAYFQAFGTAMEGTYTAEGAEPHEQPKKPPFKKATK